MPLPITFAVVSTLASSGSPEPVINKLINHKIIIPLNKINKNLNIIPVTPLFGLLITTPQFGHLKVLLLTSLSHSGHLIIAIRTAFDLKFVSNKLATSSIVK